MAVAHDAVSESHTGTTGSASEASFTWNHNPVGTPRGVLVFVLTIAADTLATAVTYGGDSLTAVSGGKAIDPADEPGTVQAWYLGTSIPTDDPAAVVVTRTNSAVVMYAVCITVTAAADTTISGTPVLVEGNGVYSAQAVDSGAATALRYAAAYYGTNNIPGVDAANTTSLGASGEIDLGSFTMGTGVETTAGSGSRSVGFSTGTTDDRAGVHLAIAESGTSLTGAVLSVTPTLPAARLLVHPVGVALAVTPSLPAATLRTDLTGIVLTATPSLPAGTVTTGTSVVGVVLEVTPSLPAGSLTHLLPGTVLTVSPSLPAATLRTNLTGIVLAVTPSLPAGEVTTAAASTDTFVIWT